MVIHAPQKSPAATETVLFSTVPSPCGDYVLLTSSLGVVALSDRQDALTAWRGRGYALEPALDRHREAVSEIAGYFQGLRREFTLSLDLRGTNFQRNVWEALLNIPYGQTRSYAEIARAVGMPGGARAVGGAVGSNPVAVIVPCHRVIGSDGSLTGYAGGLDRKRALLRLEGISGDLA